MNSNDMRKKVNGSPYHQFSILEDNRDMYMHVYSMAINKLLIIEQIQFRRAQKPHGTRNKIESITGSLPKNTL